MQKGKHAIAAIVHAKGYNLFQGIRTHTTAFHPSRVANVANRKCTKQGNCAAEWSETAIVAMQIAGAPR